MALETWISLRTLWAAAIGYLSNIVGALIVLIIGLLVAWLIRELVERIIRTLKIDSGLKAIGVGEHVERAGLQLNSAKFVGFLFYWFLVIVFVLSATQILGIEGLSDFLQRVVDYFPNIIAAVLIMLAAVLLANFLKSLVRRTVTGAKLHGSRFLGTLTWWTIVILGILNALAQLQIAPVVNALIPGLIAMLAIAGGIAFGLGGKEYAAHLFEKFRRETEGE